jgi:predicted O-methyltransferase YrrM
VTGGGSSIPEVQALLRVLAAGCRCAEVGTAFGEGAAAMAETAASLVTVEVDGERAAAARARLRACDNVELLVGDWHDVLPPKAPFELLFFDGGHWKRNPQRELPLALDLLAPSGLLVVDDMTPGRPGPDPVRSYLFEHLVAAEILTTPETAAIVAAKR